MRNSEQSRRVTGLPSADQATPPFIPLCLLARVTGLHRLLPGLVRLPDCVHDHLLVLIPLRLWCRCTRRTPLLRSSTWSLPSLERERLGDLDVAY